MSDAQIPDKPALEGLEEKWDPAWEADGTYLFDRACRGPSGRAGSSDRHSPADGVGEPAHRPRLLATRTPT